ncbi:MAG TPA: DUF3014 domain-containing protein [Myxococcales bacterium]
MGSRLWIWMLGVIIVGGAASWYLYPHDKAPLVAEVSVAPTPPAPADVPLPPASESDVKVRDALSGISPRAELKEWLAADHLLDRLAVVADNLAEDRSPNAQLPFLRPSKAFSVSHKAGKLIISARSQARYDTFANVISSLDEKKAAAGYKLLHPLLEAAYHALGYPGKPLDAVVARGLQRIADAPVRDEVAVRPSGAVYAFADAQLEALGPVEKQLLRMGPRNTRLLQGEARELAGAIGLPLQGPPQAAH